jgi:CheY-like chemotaxis protein
MTLPATLSHGAHATQFYEGASWLGAAIVEFFERALSFGAPMVMITRPRTFDTFMEQLASDPEHPLRRAAERIVFIDAEAALEGFMVENRPDPARLEATFADLLARIDPDDTGCPVWIYGEMSDVLCRRGLLSAAIELEEMWNERCTRPRLTVMCGYNIGSFDDDRDGSQLRAICRAHSHVIPAEGFTDVGDERAQLEQVTYLQQQARVRRGAIPFEAPASFPATTSVIYVVEDDESMRRSLARLLESVDLAVRTFPSAEAFLADVDRAAARGCLVLDIQLEGMSGTDLLCLMAAEGWRLPVIAMSGLHDERMEAEARRQGARTFLHKPFDAEILFDAIARALD